MSVEQDLENLVHLSTSLQPVRIILGETASKALMEAGDCFLIVAKGSYPESPGRMVIHCQPIPKDQADAACRVAMGTHRAVRRNS